MELSAGELELLREAVGEQVMQWSHIVATAKPPTEKMWNKKTKWDDLLHRIKHEQKQAAKRSTEPQGSG